MEIKYCTSEELSTLLNANNDIQIIDVREQNEFEAIRIPGSLLIPLSGFVNNYGSIDKNKPAYILCGIGKRAAKAAEFLIQNGYENVVVIDGGIKSWYELGFPVEH